MSLHTQLKSPGGITSKMDASMLGLYNTQDDASPFLEIPLPALTLKGTTQLIVTNVTRPILNETQFADFLRNALNTRNFTIYVKSKTTIHLTSALHYDVSINKGIKVPGNISIMTSDLRLLTLCRFEQAGWFFSYFGCSYCGRSLLQCFHPKRISIHA